MDMLLPAPEKIPHYLIADNVTFPGSVFPVLLYKKALQLPNDHTPGVIEEIFNDHDWCNSWRNGIYTYDHYHSTAHEVLGIYSGTCHIVLGGSSGIQLLLEKGDVLILPAGVAHKNIGSSENFKCVGAYAGGRDFDMRTGKSGERPGADKNIKHIPKPKSDPLYGHEGALIRYWKK